MSRLRGQLTDPLLSVVMPCYNERTTIEEIIRRVLAVPLRIELIVVDDGSRDGTRDILTQLNQELPFKLVFQTQNGGKGAALRRGCAACSGCSSAWRAWRPWWGSTSGTVTFPP